MWMDGIVGMPRYPSARRSAHTMKTMTAAMRSHSTTNQSMNSPLPVRDLTEVRPAGLHWIGPWIPSCGEESFESALVHTPCERSVVTDAPRGAPLTALHPLPDHDDPWSSAQRARVVRLCVAVVGPA